MSNIIQKPPVTPIHKIFQTPVNEVFTQQKNLNEAIKLAAQEAAQVAALAASKATLDSLKETVDSAYRPQRLSNIVQRRSAANDCTNCNRITRIEKILLFSAGLAVATILNFILFKKRRR